MMAPSGYTGNAIWGSSPAIDTKRGQVYIATGNNYSVPDATLACVAAAPPGPARAACLPADDYFDRIMALDLKTGAVRWATQAIDYDAWTVDCIPFIGDGDLCPDPAGPDFDFGQAPALFKTKDNKGKTIESVGAGQKSGQYWALDPDTGAVRWVTQAGPGGTAGGLQWGSAVDNTRVYTANANSNFIPWTLPGGSVTTAGVWTGINAATGELLWQVTPSHGGGTSGPVTTANGVVYGCSLDPRRVHVRPERRDGCGALELRQRRLVPLRRRDLRRHPLLGLGVQQLRLRDGEQQAVRVLAAIARMREGSGLPDPSLSRSLGLEQHRLETDY